MFPSMDGFLFRCYRCGYVLDALEVLARIWKCPLAEASARMFKEGITSRLHTSEELERYQWAELLLNRFGGGLGGYNYLVKAGHVRRRFGEWSAFNVNLSQRFLPPGLNLTRGKDTNYLVRQLRDPFGRPTRIEVWGVKHCLQLGTFTYWKTPVTFAMPRWATEMDLKEVIVCDSEMTAEVIERVVLSWPEQQRIPVVLPVDRDCFPIATNLPYPKAWFITREDGLGELGLLLYRRGMTDVKVHRIPGNHRDPMPSLERMTRQELCSPDLPDCIDDVTGRIIHGSKETMVGRLSTVMGRPWITGEAKRELLQKCAAGAGIGEEILLNQLGAETNPYALLDKGRLFVCRNGKYIMKDRRDRFSEISNFSIRSIAKTINAKGDAIHDLRLSVDGQTTTFSVTDAVLDSPPRLWREARRAAALAGLPELIMTNAQHRNLLPCLIKSTAQVASGC
jgi:hypothetical protein